MARSTVSSRVGSWPRFHSTGIVSMWPSAKRRTPRRVSGVAVDGGVQLSQAMVRGTQTVAGADAVVGAQGQELLPAADGVPRPAVLLVDQGEAVDRSRVRPDLQLAPPQYAAAQREAMASQGGSFAVERPRDPVGTVVVIGHPSHPVRAESFRRRRGALAEQGGHGVPVRAVAEVLALDLAGRAQVLVARLLREGEERVHVVGPFHGLEEVLAEAPQLAVPRPPGQGPVDNAGTSRSASAQLKSA